MTVRITAKAFLASLDEVSRRVEQGERLVVTYRGRAAFEVVALSGADRNGSRLDQDPLYQAGPVGASRPLRRRLIERKIIP